MSNDYIPVETAAVILDLSTRQVRRYAQGTDPRLRTRKIGRRTLFNREDVEVLARDFAMARIRAPNPQRKQPPPPSALLPLVDNELDPLTLGDLIPLDEAAILANLSKGTLYNYVVRGRVRAKRVGWQWLTTKAAIEEYLRSKTR